MSSLPTFRRDFSGRPGAGGLPQAAGPVLLVSTQGGHLAHLVAMRSWWEGHNRLWVCPDTPDVLDRLAGERVVDRPIPLEKT